VAAIAITAVDSETGYAQRIKAGLHDLKADEPVSAGGANTGPTPYALLLAALGACTSITLRMYAEKKGWRLGHIHVELRHDKSDDGADRIEREIRFAAPPSGRGCGENAGHEDHQDGLAHPYPAGLSPPPTPVGSGKALSSAAWSPGSKR